MDTALEWLIDFSDAEERHLISWSTHNLIEAKRLTRKRSFRYRNTIPTVKRWRRKQREAGTIDDDGTARFKLRLYESFIGYDRPPEQDDRAVVERYGSVGGEFPRERQEPELAPDEPKTALRRSSARA
jgi:hypothetical protein